MPKQVTQVPDESSTLRAFGVLELVARADGPLSHDELTQLCGLPKPSVFRILGLLQRGGLVQREPAGTDFLELGARAGAVRRPSRPGAAPPLGSTAHPS